MTVIMSTMARDHYRVTEYACAVVLVITSIILAFVQALSHDDIANGVLVYIAQAFLLAGSIFGLDLYVKRLSGRLHGGATN